MAIFGKHGHHEGNEGNEGKQHEDLTQYVHDSIRHMPHDDSGGRLGEEEGAGAELMAEALEGFEQHLHHPEWHPGRAGKAAAPETPSSGTVPADVEGEAGETRA